MSIDLAQTARVCPPRSQSWPLSSCRGTSLSTLNPSLQKRLWRTLQAPKQPKPSSVRNGAGGGGPVLQTWMQLHCLSSCQKRKQFSKRRVEGVDRLGRHPRPISTVTPQKYTPSPALTPCCLLSQRACPRSFLGLCPEASQCPSSVPIHSLFPQTLPTRMILPNLPVCPPLEDRGWSQSVSPKVSPAAADNLVGDSKATHAN